MHRKNRILFFLPLPPPVHGAALRNKSLIESPSINDHFSVRVIPFDFASDTSDIGKVSLVKCGKFLVRVLQLTWNILSFKPHVVYFNITLIGVSFYRDFLFVVLLKLLRSRLLYHLRTQGVKSQIKNSRLKRIMFRFIFKNSFVICLSEFLAKDVQDVYLKRPFIVNNGILDVTGSYPFRQISNPVPFILFISNLSRSKGVVELISAFAELRRRKVKFEGRIVGDSHDLSLREVQDLIDSHGVQNEVRLLGPKYGKEKFELLREADIFVLPTHFEAFPGAIIEAMQFSLPVIATIEGAIPEIVDDGKTGFLVMKKSVSELADKMHYLIDNPEARRTLGANGRLKYERSYNLNQFETNMKRVLTIVTWQMPRCNCRQINTER